MDAKALVEEREEQRDSRDDLVSSRRAQVESARLGTEIWEGDVRAEALRERGDHVFRVEHTWCALTGENREAER